ARAVALAAGEMNAGLFFRRGVGGRDKKGGEHGLFLGLSLFVIKKKVRAGIERQRGVWGAAGQGAEVALLLCARVLAARAIGSEAREHEAAILANPWRTGESEVLLAEAGAAALRHRHADQRAVGIEGPAVIEADQPCRVTAALVGDLGAAMGAAVEQ